MRVREAIPFTTTIVRRALIILSALVLVAVVVSCGGGGSASTPPPATQTPDFSISVSTSSVSAQVGTTVGPVTVSVSSLNGFSGSVSVAVSGLPAGITSSPAFPLNINANGSVQVTFTIPANASTGNYPVTVQATSGSLSHNWPLTLTLTAAPTITSFAANPTTIEAGTSSSLTAVFASGTGVITPGNLAVTSGTPVSVSPTTTTTYTLTVTNSAWDGGHPDGYSHRGSSASDHQLCGQSHDDHGRYKFESDGCFHQWHRGTAVTPGNLAVTSGTPVSVSPTTTTTYTLTVTQLPPERRSPRRLRLPSFPRRPSPAFAASPATITAGASSSLTAVFTNGTGR